MDWLETKYPYIDNECVGSADCGEREGDLMWCVELRGDAERNDYRFSFREAIDAARAADEGENA